MIINHMLDQDLYKISMQQFALHQFPNVEVEYEFKCRNEGIDLSKYYDTILENIVALENLELTPKEYSYLKTLPFLKEDYVDFLKMYRFNPKKHVTLYKDGNDILLKIKGPWVQTILYEVPMLAIINSVYFQNECPFNISLEKEGYKRLSDKIQIRGFKWADFGTRRRRSYYWHDKVLEASVKHPDFVGTSNIHFAMKYGIKPIGTMAHEVFMVMQALVRLADSQKHGLQKWADEYRGDLGIALTDTLGIDKFLKDFDRYFALLFDGVRQDSGDPKEWFDKIYNHYLSLNIDPSSKSAIFSDGLNFEKASELHDYVGGRMKDSYGIGTNLTNDLGPDPLQIVIKPTTVNGSPVAKISDSEGKIMCKDDDYISYLRKVICD